MLSVCVTSMACRYTKGRVSAAIRLYREATLPKVVAADSGSLRWLSVT